MKIVPIIHSQENSMRFNITLSCCSCKKIARADKLFADLDGEPFKSYYCKPCSIKAQRPFVTVGGAK